MPTVSWVAIMEMTLILEPEAEKHTHTHTPYPYPHCLLRAASARAFHPIVLSAVAFYLLTFV